MTRHTYTTSVGRSTSADDHPTVTDFEVELTVTYEYHPGSRGTRDGMARFAEPDEEPGVEIIDIVDEDGEEFPVSVEEEDRIIEDIMAAHASGGG